MKISVKVKPNSKIEKVEKAVGFWIIHVKEPPQEDKANRAVINLLSAYFKVPKSRISILKGKKSRQKIVGIINLTS
ncbi:MAG TPA: DUF167 domain-containing protein [candidate division Zixibacteria bacterium]|nr:DUF167 domain-containing protein [candidate division Zixibacteria bacterium]